MAGAGSSQKGVAWKQPQPVWPKSEPDVAKGAALGCGGLGIVALVIVVGLSSITFKGCDLSGFLLGASCTKTEDPLLQAAADGDVDGLETALDSGSDTGASQEDRDEALGCAAKEGQPQTVARLLVAGANPNADTSVAGHPLVAVVSNGSPDPFDEDAPARLAVAQLLLESHADPDRALRSAAERSDPAIVGLLLHAGAPINGQPYEASPLASAVFAHNTPVVDLLLSRGADPNEGGRPSAQVVRWSITGALCSRGRPEHPTVDCVLAANRAGAQDPQASTTPPTTAAGTLAQLIPDDAFVDGSQITPLTVAVLGGDPATAAKLLAAGADPNRPSLGRFTPLWLAVDLQDRDLATTLLRAGAQADPPPASGLASPLALARTLPTPDLADLLTTPLPPP